jgi:hypothetical protein
VKTPVPKHLASLFDNGLSYVTDARSFAEGYVGATGSLYVPNAMGDAQLYPNKHQISCFRREAAESNCYVASTSMMGDDQVNVDLSIFAITQWSSRRVVAEDDGAVCVTQRWEFDLMGRRAAFYKMGKVGADPKLCGDPGRATFMAILGAVQWVGR